MTLRDTAGVKIAVTNWDYSPDHFEGVLSSGRHKGKIMLFLKSRIYTRIA